MTQEKRSLLAGLLSLIVLMGWYYFFGEKPGAVPPKVSTPLSQPVQSETRLKSLRPAEADSPKKGRESSHHEQPEKFTVKEAPNLTVGWTNRGGRLSKVLVNHYRQGLDRRSPAIDLIPFEGERAAVLVCTNCNFALPEDTDYSLASEGEASLTYEAVRDRILFRKEYVWEKDPYLLNLHVTVENKSDREIRGRPGLEWKAHQLIAEKGGLQFLKGPGNQRNFVYKSDKDVKRGPLKEEIREVQGAVTWAGVEDRYFLISLISRRVSSDQLLRLEKGVDWLNLSLYPGELSLPPHTRQDEHYSLYLGPKERELLQVAGVGLEDAVDYGWFSLIAIPILKLLQFFHSFVGNWGLAIILLTLFAKILLNPLTLKSMKQMKEMQRLQPQLVALKERYKNDRQRLNLETMQLFKTHKVNPMGGCFPMLLQMPIYIALYKVLYNSIELYHAPFFGPYQDLSAPDPFFVLPVLLGVSMFLQQRLTPNPSADPVQRQMMMIMPVMFTAFMLFLPVGLVVYIFINTATSVAQQWMYQRGIRWRDVLMGLSIRRK